jgi:hypothetical protein
MTRQLLASSLFCLLLGHAGVGRTQTLEPVDAEKLRQKAITTIAGPVGDLLKKWWQEGTAAGNIGDYYDNRDGDHSPLNIAQFPQLVAVKYSPADIKLKKHWGAQQITHPAVVFGNSSTSAPPTLGGSNPRSYYCFTRGLAFLAEEYAKNNLYIYPEHRDHDPGHNGGVGRPAPNADGFGDMYPTNTPYLLISQGSSGSDQPFMRAVPLTLAAFRPEVKRKLTETGTLMPALQMILRSTSKQLKSPDDYLTGKAHPSVFEGSWIDELAMVKLAHSMGLKALPPHVQLKVVEQPTVDAGVDYFEQNLSETLADTPAVIARIHRSRDRSRRLVVSAEGSRDLNQAPLTFKWVILRGDPERIQIKPRNANGSVAEISVAHHERRPIAAGSPMESNRVDIGIFVNNGTYYSAPGFVTIYTLDSEARTYDAKGHIAEIAYNMGETDLRVTDWQRVLDLLGKDALAGGLFNVNEQLRAALQDLAQQHLRLSTALREAQARVKAVEMDEKTAPDKDRARKDTDAARKHAAAVQTKITALLEEKQPAMNSSLRAFIDDGCRRLARKDHHDLLDTLAVDGTQPRPAELLKKIYQLGVIRKNATPTAYDHAQLEYVHLALIADRAFPGAVQATYQPNFVDQRLTAPKLWRDVYHYDANDQCTGWTRYHPDRGPERFNHDGLLVVERDDLGRCKKARTVRYTRSAAKALPNPNPLRMELGDTFITYTFTGPDDRRGQRSASEPVK